MLVRLFTWPTGKDEDGCFGTSERFWMNLWARYDLEVERDGLEEVLDQIRPLGPA